jgi:hypothetical protein
MKTAVLTCVYPSAEPFLPDFWHALKNQSNRHFDVLIGNDGLKSLRYDLPFLTKVRDFSGSPSAVRKQTIRWAIGMGYEGLIFADADDVFPPNRVGCLKRHLEAGTPVIFHDLHLCNEKGETSCKSMFEGRFHDHQEICESDLKHFNFMGLTNTAVRTHELPKVIALIPDETVAFDWAFYVRLLSTQSLHIPALYTNETVTYYRQHGNNIASPNDLTDKQIRLGVDVKAKHYAAIADLDPWYGKMAHAFLHLGNKLDLSPSFQKIYMQKVRAMAPPNPLWWETARLADELGMVES